MKLTVIQTYGFGLFLLLVGTGCDGGLEPEPVVPEGPSTKYGIAGTVHFRNWPPPDSVKNLAIVAFKNRPSGNLFDIVSDPSKANFALLIVQHGSDSVTYELLLYPTPPGPYQYIAVAQQYGPNITADWRVAGIYYSGGDTTLPATVVVPPNAVVRGIDITVDFNNRPPQP